MLDAKARRLLAAFADRYETESFLEGDPSCFMHRVSGDANREATAFVAASLSFGARSQFLPRVQWIIDRAGGDVDGWIRAGRFERDVPPDACRADGHSRRARSASSRAPEVSYRLDGVRASAHRRACGGVPGRPLPRRLRALRPWGDGRQACRRVAHRKVN